MNDQDLTDQSYSNKPSHERVISSISNRNLNTLKDYHNRGLNVQTGNVQDDVSSIHLITKLRSGGDNLPENPDQNLEKIDESLKESVRLDKLQKNLASKSVKDSKSFTEKLGLPKSIITCPYNCKSGRLYDQYVVAKKVKLPFEVEPVNMFEDFSQQTDLCEGVADNLY